MQLLSCGCNSSATWTASPAPRSALPRKKANYKVRGSVKFVESGRIAVKPRSRCVARTTQLDRPVEQTTPDSQESVEPFDWNKAWYPIAIEEDINPLAPKHIEVLGRQFVLWNYNGEWRCFDEACPHRLAPLSEGRIEQSDGSLMCSYHGWRFDGAGDCVNIPQVRKGAQDEGSPCKNSRSKVQTFPTKSAGGMIWMWPDDSPSAYIDSSMVEPYFGDFDVDDVTTAMPLYSREVAYPLDILIENVVDPSHVPYSHHGVQGNRESVGWMEGKLEKVPEGDRSAIRVRMESLLKLNSGKKEIDARDAKDEKSNEMTVVRQLDFIEPSTAIYSFMGDGNAATGFMVVNMVPTSASKSMLFFRVVLLSALPWFAKLLIKFTRPKWRTHLENSTVLDGDMVLLNGQARILREAAEKGKGWNSEYFIPSSADLMIAQFRKWFHGKRGGGGPKLPNGELLLSGRRDEGLDKRQILDRYHSHTKHCKACLGAMRNFGILESWAKALAAALSVVSLMMVKNLLNANGSASLGQIGQVACVGLGVLVSLFASFKAKYMKQQFVYAGYDHWKK